MSLALPTIQTFGQPGFSSPSAPTVNPRTNQPYSSSLGTRAFSPSAPRVDTRTGQPFFPAPGAGEQGGVTGRAFSPSSRFTPGNSRFSTSSRLDAAANLGVVLDAQGNRLQVSSVDSNALGAAAGFQVGDQILGVNRAWTTSPQMLQGELTTALQSEGRAWVAVNRNGARQWVNVDPSGRSRAQLGVHVFDDGGIVHVAQVSPNSAAARGGVHPGDVILSVNGEALTSHAQLTGLVRAAAAGKGEVILVLRRNGKEQTLQANLPRSEHEAVAQAATGTSGEFGAATSPLTLNQLRAKSERLRSKLRGLLESSDAGSESNVTEAKATVRELLQTLADVDRSR